MKAFTCGGPRRTGNRVQVQNSFILGQLGLIRYPVGVSIAEPCMLQLLRGHIDDMPILRPDHSLFIPVFTHGLIPLGVTLGSILLLSVIIVAQFSDRPPCFCVFLLDVTYFVPICAASQPTS